MSSVFKGSCFIFWITWLLCFSYLLATIKFVYNHVMYDETMADNLLLLNIVCYCTIAFSFMGCIFMKCDVTSIYCALLFGIPTGIFLPGASIYGAVKLSKVGHAQPTQEQAFALVKHYFRDNERVPHWLTQTEDEFKCCGINGPQDYREIYRFAGQETCMKFEDDIPCSCCAESLHHVEKVSQGAVNCVTGNDKRHCMHNGDTEWMKHVAYANGSDPSNFTLEAKCTLPISHKFSIKTFLSANDSSGGKQGKAQVSEKGCYENLKSYYDRMSTCMLVFYIVLTICPILMLTVFFRDICKSTTISGEPSDYSLDVQSTSKLDVRAPDKRN